MPDRSAALLDHILSRMGQDVQFLVDENYITAEDAAVIIAHLPASARQAEVPSGVPIKIPPPSHAGAQPVRARALWAYNENSKDPNDLSFSAGDVIEVVEETNIDWWSGRINNRQGLFPSNYVEKIHPTAASSQTRTSVPIAAPTPSSTKKPYKPFKAAHHGNDTPAGQTNSIGLIQDPGHEQRSGRFGAIKDTVTNSAARGAGASAGAAIGRGLVRKII